MSPPPARRHHRRHHHHHPRIAFVTVCKGRALHLKQTLPDNLANNPDPESVFVVLDYGSDDDLIPYLQSHHAEAIATGKLVVYQFKNAGPFHMAHAKNMAARCGIREGADILVTLDADNFTGPGFDKFILAHFSKPRTKPETFLYPDFAAINQMPWDEFRPRRGYHGRLAVWADIFVKLGGYDEQFNIWGSEDIDMLGRLKRMGYTGEHFETHNLQVVSHGPEVRFKEYPEAKKHENKAHWKAIGARTETVVNFGTFGCGVVHRNFVDEMILLERMPTRIFGIGMQKTATSSLHQALQILGFDSLHWGEGEAPLIWYEMQGLGHSPTLERFYAATDNPIPLLYRQLDAAYPNSKFILTIRDEVDWLQSVKQLWDARTNPDRPLWDVYPISHVLHTALYGCKDFDALVFLERYRRHNAQVLEYFKDRPDDLLVLDMDCGDGWEKLCAFLDCEVPGEPYPWKNKTPPCPPPTCYPHPGYCEDEK